MKSMTHYYRKMLSVQRMQGAPIHRSYNLAEHSFLVTLLYLDICRELNLAPTPQQIESVMKHDFLEVLTADLPYPVKNLNSNTKAAWAIIEQEALDDFIGDVPERIEAVFNMDDESLKAILGDTFVAFEVADLFELLCFCMDEFLLGNCTAQVKSIISGVKEMLSDHIPISPLLKSILENDYAQVNF